MSFPFFPSSRVTVTRIEEFSVASIAVAARLGLDECRGTNAAVSRNNEQKRNAKKFSTWRLLHLHRVDSTILLIDSMYEMLLVVKECSVSITL